MELACACPDPMCGTVRTCPNTCSRGLAMWDPRINVAEAHGTSRTRGGSEPNESIFQSCGRPDALPLPAFLKSSPSDDDDLVSRFAQEDWEVVTSMVGPSRGNRATMLSTTIKPSAEASVDDKPRRRGGRRSTTKLKQRQAQHERAASLSSVTPPAMASAGGSGPPCPMGCTPVLGAADQ